MRIFKNSSGKPGQTARSPPSDFVGQVTREKLKEVNAMENYSSRPAPTRRHDDRELADVLIAISVVSRRLARKLTAASFQKDSDYY